jgi:hypothetical protein
MEIPDADKIRWGIEAAGLGRSVCQPYAYQNGALWTLLSSQPNDGTQPNRLTMFNGGCFKFDYSLWSSIKAARLRDIVAGYPLFDNEFAQSSEGIRFFVEVDYRTSVVAVQPSRVRLLADAVVIQSVLRGLFPQHDCSCVFLDCHLKMKTEDTVAVGSHLIFSGLVVDSETGAKLCAVIQGQTKLAVDSAPYKTNFASLRPVFSRKLAVCPDCRGFAGLQTDCVVCKGVGKVGQGSYYIPRKVIDRVGRVKEYQGEDTSIIPDGVGLFTNFY